MHTFVTLVDEKPGVSIAANLTLRANYRTGIVLAFSLILSGCKPTPTPTPTPKTDATPTAAYPPRPTTTPSPFKLFHYYNSSFTLTTPDNAPTTRSPPWYGNSATPPAPTLSTNSISPRRTSTPESPVGSTSIAAPNAPAKNTPLASSPAKPPTTPPATTPTPTNPSGTRASSSTTKKKPQLWNSEAPYTPPAN